MVLPDNNILINAFRPDSPHHQVARQWLEDSLNAGRSIRLFPTVEAGFLRVVTHPKIFSPASPLEEASAFLRVLCSCPTVEICPWTPSARERWCELCASPKMSGNDCNDAMLVAICLYRGLQLVTFDQGFRRFPGLQLLLLDAE
ncbi:PIN domain-containing protein [Ruficoccus amylovorans]|uniref:Ribonuclease VapC n=1 Tax=Ruficoccus amylovorans TaxID=1804625 RepID=A0A842HBL5_9BACT|nr:PIN domain-containing protein [Ruficoccus amylovorans]